MPDYVIADGKSIVAPSGTFGAGESADFLCPEDVALFLADGVIKQASEGDPVADAPVLASPPPDDGGEAAGDPPEFDVPERWPSIGKMPGFLAGRGAAEVRFLRAADPRASASADKPYRDALAALEGE